MSAINKDRAIEEVTNMLLSRRFERFFNDHLIQYDGQPINKRNLSQFIESNLPFIKEIENGVTGSPTVSESNEFSVGEEVKFIGKAENYLHQQYKRYIKAERVTIKAIKPEPELGMIFECEFYFGQYARKECQFKYHDIPITDLEKM